MTLVEMIKKYSSKYTVMAYAVANEPTVDAVSADVYVVCPNGKIAMRYELNGWEVDENGEPKNPTYELAETDCGEIADVYFDMLEKNCKLFQI